MFIELHGRITESGTLEVTLPKGIAPGDVTVRIEPSTSGVTWTDEEIAELLRPRRKPMHEVIAWLDANPPTEEWGGMKPEDDAAEFIHNLRNRDQFRLEDPGESE